MVHSYEATQTKNLCAQAGALVSLFWQEKGLRLVAGLLKSRDICCRGGNASLIGNKRKRDEL